LNIPPALPGTGSDKASTVMPVTAKLRILRYAAPVQRSARRDFRF
jgi:hypothetical protein